jgi:hypothetical protein
VENINSIKAYKHYIDQCPFGGHVRDAKLAIKKLKRKRVQETADTTTYMTDTLLRDIFSGLK